MGSVLKCDNLRCKRRDTALISHVEAAIYSSSATAQVVEGQAMKSTKVLLVFRLHNNRRSQETGILKTFLTKMTYVYLLALRINIFSSKAFYQVQL